MTSTFYLEDSAFLRAVLYGLGEGVVVANLEGKFLLFNPSAKKMLGIGAKDIGPEEWTGTYGCLLPDKTTPYPPDLLPLARGLRGEEIKDELIFIQNPHRQSGLWISVSGRPLRYRDGEIWGGLAIFRDVTELMETKESSHSSTLRFSALVENQEIAILVENENRQIQLVNKAFCDLFYIPFEPMELIGIDFTKYADQAKTLFQDPDEFSRRIKQLVKDRDIVTNEKLLMNNGKIIERDYIPVFAGSENRGHVWQYRDITDREKTLQGVKLMERLSRALEQTADSVVITNTRGCIEYVNHAFETTTGFSRAEAMGKTPKIIKSGAHDNKFYQNLWNQIKAGHSYRGTIINRKKNGELYSTEQSITPIKDDEGNITHYVSVLKDITELLKQKEQEVEMRLARNVQQCFFPDAVSLPGLEIAGDTCPADETGGDYFDFIVMPNGCLAVIIGDVCGHGISSALVMAEMRAYLRSYSTSCSDIGEILTKTNAAIEMDLDHGRFVTLLMICIDPQKRILTYANAGHEYGYLLNASDTIDFVFESTGPPLGLFPDTCYSTSEALTLGKDQLVLLITDGVYDSLAGKDNEFLAEKAVKYVHAHRHETAAQIATGLCQESKSHAKKQLPRDDITSVVIKIL